MFKWLIAAMLMSMPVQGFSDDTPPCMRELEIDFFKIELLSQALSLYDVPQGQWTPIYQDLISRSQTVPYRVREKAKAYEKNPLDFPFNGEEAKKLLRQSLEEVFIEVLEDNDVSDRGAIVEMFNFLYQHHLPTINDCMKEQD